MGRRIIKRVLVTAGQAFSREAACTVLDHYRHEVIEAADGKPPRPRHAKIQPNVALLDLHSPCSMGLGGGHGLVRRYAHRRARPAGCRATMCAGRRVFGFPLHADPARDTAQ